MLIRLLRLFALLLITLIVVWALVLGWWQSNDHTPSATENLLYLIALPVALFGGFILLNGFINGLRNPSPPKPAEATAAAPTANERTDDAERRQQLVLLASALITPAGQDVPAVIAAAQTGKAPKPDATLKDEDGFPVFSGRIDDLDLPAFVETIQPFADTDIWPDTMLRNLAMADRIFSDLFIELRDLLDPHPQTEFELRIDWVLDGPLDDASVARIEAWLHETHLAAFAPRPLRLKLHAATDDLSALRLIDETIIGLNRMHTPAVAMIVASMSNLSDPRIMQWQRERRLFTPQQQSGQMPGEAASGVLLATETTARLLAPESPLHLSRINMQPREKPADAGGRISADLCVQLSADLLRLLDCPAASIAALVSDGDHRATRQAEALGVIDESFEALDPSQHYAPIGSVCGSAAPVTALLALQCAAQVVQDCGAPVLALSVQHPTLRAAALIQPPPAPEPTN